MAVSPAELARIDAELNELAAGIDLERAWAEVRSAPRDLDEVDATLAALAADVPIPAAHPRRLAAAPAPSPRAPVSARPPAPAPVGVAAAVEEPATPAAAPEKEVAAAAAPPRTSAAPSEAPVAAADAIAEIDGSTISAEALLNPFEEPSAAAESADDADDERTLVIDASEFGGLDMDALFDGMVEEALSAPLDEGGIAGARSLPPMTEPPPGGGRLVEGSTDVEELRPDDADDLELFVEDGSIGIEADDALDALEALEAPSEAAIAEADGDPDDDSPKKKGFFKKLFG